MQHRLLYSLCLILYVNHTSAQVSIKIVSYNIQMLPTSVKNVHQDARVQSIANNIRDYDVIVFSEAFDDDMRNIIKNDLNTSHPFSSCILGIHEGCNEGDREFCQDGGVIIFSKHPIVEQAEVLYYKTDCDMSKWAALWADRPECWGSDCKARKGAKYIKIEKEGIFFHIFGSHAQATYNDRPFETYRKARELQFRILHHFIKQQNIPSVDPVLIAGDLNVDMIGKPDEYENMLSILEARFSDNIDKTYTFDPINNCLAESGNAEYLDYILFKTNHRNPQNSAIRTLKLKSDQSYISKGKNCNDLSDHYALEGEFIF